MYEIRPGYPKALSVVRLSWLTPLGYHQLSHSILWHLVRMFPEEVFHTGPIRRKQQKRPDCSSYFYYILTLTNLLILNIVIIFD